MKQLFYLVILGAGIIGCTSDTESLNDLDATQELNAIVDISGCTTITEDFDSYGSLEIINDDQTLYVSVVAAEGWEISETGISVVEQFSDFPITSGNENLPPGQLNSPDDLAEGSTYYTWEIPLSEFVGDEILIAARTTFSDGAQEGTAWAGDISAGNNNQWSYLQYTIQICEEEEEEECESGYMIGSKNFSEIGTSNNWGWAHEFDFNDATSSETREIHHKNGSLGGEVTITYEDGNISIEEGEGVNITHLYISDDEPTTNAPGQFDKEQTYTDDDGNFWVIVKAEVCEVPGEVEPGCAGPDNSITMTESEAAALPSWDEVRKLYLSLLEPGVSREGTFDPSIWDLINAFNEDEDMTGEYTTTYTITDGDCTDSVDLTVIVVSDDSI